MRHNHNPSACFPRFFRPAASLLVLLLVLLPVLCAATVSMAAERGARRVRPAFEPALVRRQTVSGVVRFRIVARTDGLPQEFATIGANGWTAVVRVDGHVIAARAALPALVTWDTRLAGDGDHEVHVAVRNDRADQEVGVEGALIVVDNAAADTAREAALSHRAPGEDASLLPQVQVPETAIQTVVAARVTASVNLLSTRATALLPTESRLYLGLPEGGIAFCATGATGAASRKAAGSVVIRLPVSEGAVTALAVGGERLWWTTADGRAVYACGIAGRRVTRYDVTGFLVSPAAACAKVSAEPEAPPKLLGWVRSLALLRGRVLLMGDAGVVRVLDPRTGALLPVEAGLLPDEALATDGPPAVLRLSAADSDGDRGDSGDPAVLAAVTPTALPEPPAEPTETNSDGDTRADSAPAAPRWRRYTLRAWRRTRGSGWNAVAAFATDADPARAGRLAVAPGALATAEREGPQSLVFAEPSGASPGVPRGLPYALSPGMPSSTDRIAVGASGLWWEQRGIVFHADPRTSVRDAYLPWNVSAGTGAVTALAPDKDGVWVATMTGGVRHIVLGRPSPRDGYNGYIRAPLGAETLRPPTPRCGSMAEAIDAWQGTRYVWGGQSRSGTDCSGFVMRMHQVCGVSVPRTSSEMRRGGQGKHIVDTLRWGDTLVYPGHCGIYIGDGRTAETVGGTRGGSVSHSSIWVRGSVVVKRFLH